MPARKTNRSNILLTLVICAIAAAAAWAVVLVRQQPAREARQHIDAGIESVRRGQSRGAEREWLQAAKVTPNDPNVWELLSELYINTEQWPKGTSALKQLLRTAPNRPYIYSRMAACALRSGDETEAQRLALEEIKRNPKDEASLNILAFLSGMQESTEQQISYLNRLRGINPKDLDTLHSLAQAYYESSRYADVIPVTDQIVALAPRDSSALTLRGAARYEVDASPVSNSQCEADLLAALQVNPMAAFARFTLGRVYLREAKYPQAVFQLELAQKLFPRKLDVPFELAKAYSRMGQPAKAAAARNRFETLREESTRLSALKKQCSLERNNFATHLEVGQTMLENGDLRQAMYYIQRALILQPRNADAQKAWKRLEAQFNTQVPGPGPVAQ